ncbi:hypothetical protein Patl1_13896 [Pistacia atlantica]|uniref:Uncharacterized protein n=1 Tax=Pistacia atlantica TaxID=434234 RepID=A0ACC1AXY7_9ROSI|nr:hypothetical protein Patl1_13896 [Pistacia atlantica]
MELLPDALMENKILPPPSGTANLLHKTNSLSGQRNPHGLLLDSKSEAVSSGHQTVKDQYHSWNSILPTLQRSLPLNKMPDGKTIPVSNGPSQTYNLFSQEETLLLPHILEFSGKQVGQTQVGPSVQDIMSFGYKYDVADNQSTEVQNSSSESLRPSNLLHQSFHDERSVDLEGKKCILETRNYKTYSALKQNDPKLDTAESSVATVSSGFCAQGEHAENDRSLQYKTPVHIDTLGCISNNSREDDQSHRDGSIQMKKETKISRSNSSLVEKISLNTGGNPNDIVLRNDLRSDNSHSSSKLSNEKNILLAGKLASTIAGKFWDGSLQLNSSVSVSAVAFFKRCFFT